MDLELLPADGEEPTRAYWVHSLMGRVVLGCLEIGLC